MSFKECMVVSFDVDVEVEIDGTEAHLLSATIRNPKTGQDISVLELLKPKDREELAIDAASAQPLDIVPESFYK